MRPILILVSLALLSTDTSAADEKEPLARVAVAVADLRREPVRAGRGLDHDPWEESQLLYGEQVKVLEEIDGWARVEAVEQLEWSHEHRWTGYPGWVEKEHLVPESESWKANVLVITKLAYIQPAPGALTFPKLRLSLGSRLMELPPLDDGPTPPALAHHWRRVRLLDGSTGWVGPDQIASAQQLAAERSDPARLRQRIVETARLFLGDPYYWGGRSAHDPAQTGVPHTAVDCSGLVGLVYQANGFVIPRDAHEQWMKARKITRHELEPGDLVFLSEPDHPDRIGHVMLYAGKGQLIEGPGTGSSVRQIGLEERLKETAGRPVRFGSYLP